jgi:hypothetical protein
MQAQKAPLTQLTAPQQHTRLSIPKGQVTLLRGLPGRMALIAFRQTNA